MVRLTDNARAWFDEGVRAAGELARPGSQVEILTTGPSLVTCRVTDGEQHILDLHTEVGGVEWPGTCSCAAFQAAGPCTHLWLALQECETLGADRLRDLGVEFRAADRPLRAPRTEPASPPPHVRIGLLLAEHDGPAAQPRACRLVPGHPEILTNIPSGSLAARIWDDPEQDEATRIARLAAAGCLFASLRDAAAGRALRHDPEPTYQLELDPSRDLEQGEIEVWGQLRRPRLDLFGTPVAREALPLSALRHRHASWFCTTDHRLIRISGSGAPALIASLLRDGPIRVPLHQEDQLRQILGDLPWQESPTTGSPPCLGHMYAEIRQLPGTTDPQEEVGCVLGFVYGEFKVHAGTGRGLFVHGPDTDRERLPDGRMRDPNRERHLLREFLASGGRATSAPGDRMQGRSTREEFPALVSDLIDSGWIVEVNGRRILDTCAPQLQIQTEQDWLDLRGGLRFGGQVAPLPSLLQAARDRSRLLQLPDGSRALLPQTWLQRLQALRELSHGPADTLRFRRNQAFVLDALLAAQESNQVAADAGFSALRRRLRSFVGFRPAAPACGFGAELRPYQREALGWMQGLAQIGLGGCLADDMGLGKTVQVLACLHGWHHRAAPDRPPSVVVAPSSLVFNWQREAARFAPQLRCLAYIGNRRAALRQDFAAADLIITTYGVLRRDIEVLQDYRFLYAVLDEAQTIKNSQSLAARACRLLRAEHRLALSGTPIENHLGELWSLFDFLNPGMLGRSARLQDLRRLRDEEPEEEARIQALGQALRPFFLRRTKDQVLHELPAKTEQLLYCELGPRQREEYERLRRHFQGEMQHLMQNRDFDSLRTQMLEALLRLRQAACSLRLLAPQPDTDASAKLDLLLPRLAELASQGHKALVFSQFVRFLGELRETLEAEGIQAAYLDGRTRDRQAEVDRFQSDPDCQVFLISIKAGGAGLNLTAADYVFLLDPWWNPAVEAQAIDRSHRMGQQRPVTAIRLIAKGTIEEKVLQLQDSKRALARAVFGEHPSLLRSFSQEDLAVLLS